MLVRCPVCDCLREPSLYLQNVQQCAQEEHYCTVRWHHFQLGSHRIRASQSGDVQAHHFTNSDLAGTVQHQVHQVHCRVLCKGLAELRTHSFWTSAVIVQGFNNLFEAQLLLTLIVRPSKPWTSSTAIVSWKKHS